MKNKGIEIIEKTDPESDNEIELKPGKQTKKEAPPPPTPTPERSKQSFKPTPNSKEFDEPEIKEPKPKRVLTDKQKETLAKGRESRDLKRRERFNENTKKAEEEKKVIEQKIVKKAIQIKKKQIKREKVIALSDDDEEDEEPSPPPRQRAVKAPVYRQPQTAPKNKVFFV